MTLLAGVRARTVDTDRLRVHVCEAGPEAGRAAARQPVDRSVLRARHGRRAAAVPAARSDMRGFGRAQPVPIDATRGLRDWADDTHALVRALGIERPVHLVGWSTGGAAIAGYAMDRRVASLTFVGPVTAQPSDPEQDPG